MGLFRRCSASERFTMSAHLSWMIIKRNNSFLLKRNGQVFSKEPCNLKSKHSYRYSGLIHKKAIGVEPSADGRGVVLVTRKTRNQNKPAKSMSRVELKKGSRRALSTIRNFTGKNRYRKDLKMAALRRASAILRSQKPVVPKKTKAKKSQ